MSLLTSELDRGDGVCVHLDLESNLCQIYEDRPDICRIDLQYQKYFADRYDWESFVAINLRVCVLLPDK